MTLRLRLTLLTTLLVALILALSGVGLHLLLASGLYRSLDTNLQGSGGLLAGFIEQDEEAEALQPEAEVSSRFGSGLVALLVTAEGRVLDSLGEVPTPIPNATLGFSTQALSGETWRVWGERVRGGTLLTLADTRMIAASVRRFDLSFLLLAPLALGLAFGLGYLFAGRALRPVRRLTDDALELATRRAWRERLPEPKRKDELWRLSQATNTLLGALAEVIESERRFTADAAHELRTPLTVLRGRLEQALEKTADVDRARVPLRAALGASDDLLELVEKLLLLARTEAGQGLDKTPVALDEVAFEVAEAFRPLFDEKKLQLVLELPDEPVRVAGDRVALGLLVRNLLDNALKFTATGEVGVRVAVHGSTACLHVWDTGPGLPEDALARVFGRFYQADVRHRQLGSGLGLALAQSIAVWHGGSLSVVNRPEGGSAFTLALPGLISKGSNGRELRPEISDG